MAGYRAGYSEAHSPTWEQGRQDGQDDRARLCLDPPQDPVGPNPPDPAHPAMYNRGYESGFQGE